MKIEVGKAYETRLGQLVQIDEKRTDSGVDIYIGRYLSPPNIPHKIEWHNDGHFLVQSIPHVMDIVCEYTEPLNHKKELDSKGFGRLVNAFRIHLKMSVREVAAQIGASGATVSRIENGKKPDIDTYLSLCSWMRQPNV